MNLSTNLNTIVKLSVEETQKLITELLRALDDRRFEDDRSFHRIDIAFCSYDEDGPDNGHANVTSQWISLEVRA